VPDAALELHTLSGARLTTDSGTELLGPGKPLAFLIYLACSPRQTASREHLIDLLWSDLPAEKARHALRQTLWYLRQLLPEGLRVSGSDVLLVTPLRLDRDEFLREAAADHLERAVTIYQHEFLNAFAVPGGLEFEHWAEIERQQLSAVFLRVVEQLCRRYLDAGRFAEAIALARRARDAAPASERTWRLLLEALHRLTDPIGFALENFDSAGEFRTTENGVPIDATGELNGGPFVGSTGLAKAVHDDPAATACVAQRAFAFETGFMPTKADPKWQQIQDAFAASHYDVLALMRAIAVSELSYRVPGQALTAAAR